MNLNFLRDILPILRKWKHFSRKEIFVLSYIFGELLQGVKTKREKNILEEYYENVESFDGNDLLVKAGIFSYEKKLLDKGIGIIDTALLYICFENNFQIWTLDKKILRFLKEEGYQDLIY